MLIGNLASRGRVAFIAAAALLAGPALSAQDIRTINPAPPSIISLAPAPRPQGEILARNPGDATFEHAPANYHVFAAGTVGENAGVESLTLDFARNTKLISIQSRGKDFVVESGGSCHEGNGYARGDSCSLLVRFNPQGPGHRLGHLEVAHSAQAEPFYVGLTGNGYAPVVSFTPSQISTVSGTVSSGTGTIKSATNITVDGGDDVYIADTGNNAVKEIDSSGTITTTPAFLSGAVPVSIAVDSVGIVYAANVSGNYYYFTTYFPWDAQTYYPYTYKNTACTASAPCAFSSVGMSDPAQVSIDPYDNLFMEEKTKGALEMPVGDVAGGSGALNLWHLSDTFAYANGSPLAFAADANDNLYTFYTFSPPTLCWILEEPLYGAENGNPSFTRVAGAARCGYSGDGGQGRSAEISSSVGQITFDIAGNLYFTDTGNLRVRRIDAATGIISTIAGSGGTGYSGDGGPATSATLSNPTGVTVDSQGQVYILSNAPTAGPTQVLRKVGVLGYENFGGELKGTTSTARVVNVSNTGNDTLTLSVAGFFNGTNPGNFALDPNTTTCALSAAATLDAGRSCKIGFLFKPSGGGAFSANYVLQDNTVTNTNTIELVGTGTLPSPTALIKAPTAGSTVTSGGTVTFTASVTSATTPAPTGTVTFKVNGATIGSAVTLSAGSASTTFKASTTGSNTLQAVYSGDSNYATATAAETITVTAAASKTALTSSANPATDCKPVDFSVSVTGTSGVKPTGKVELKKSTMVLATATLNNAAAKLSTSTLPVGTNMLTASYSGDARNGASASPAIKQIVLSGGGSCRAIRPILPPVKPNPIIPFVP